jgi:hypothetical protein
MSMFLLTAMLFALTFLARFPGCADSCRRSLADVPDPAALYPPALVGPPPAPVVVPPPSPNGFPPDGAPPVAVPMATVPVVTPEPLNPYANGRVACRSLMRVMGEMICCISFLQLCFSANAIQLMRTAEAATGGSCTCAVIVVVFLLLLLLCDCAFFLSLLLHLSLMSDEVLSLLNLSFSLSLSLCPSVFRVGVFMHHDLGWHGHIGTIQRQNVHHLCFFDLWHHLYLCGFVA